MVERRQLGLDPKVTRISEIVRDQDVREGPRGAIHIGGLPSDAGIISERRGQRFGPSAIRRSLYSLSAYCTDHKTDISALQIIDHGDAELVPYDYNYSIRKSAEFARNVIPGEDNGRTIFLGGDHSITGELIKEFCLAYSKEEVGVMLLDSHHDIREPWTNNSGSWGWDIMENNSGPIKRGNFVQIGVHGLKYSPYYEKMLESLGIKYYTSGEVWESGIKKIVSESLSYLKERCEVVYVSLDIDVLDQAFAPGVSAASPGGLTPRELFSAMYLLGRDHTVEAVDVMELSPPLDRDNITEKTAAEAIAHFLCGVASTLK